MVQRWMGGWSEQDLAMCPKDKFDRIVHRIAEEFRQRKEAEEARKRERGITELDEEVIEFA